MTAERPTVSIVTANYNGARHLAAAVRSVLAQTLRSWELIVVDDCSTDDSLAVIEAAAGGDPRVRVIVQARNGGPAAARNRALAEARGRWIAVFDSDDLMAPERLAKLVRRGEADRADVVVDNLCVFTDGSDEPWKPFLAGRDYGQPRWISLADYIGSAKMYSSRPGLGYLKPLFFGEVMQGVRYREDLKIGEDYELVLRLLARGCRMRLEPEPLYRYRKHSGSISHRMRREHIEQMLAADAALEAEIAAHGPEVRRAQAARRKSLESAIAYDRVIERLKAKDLAGGVAASLAKPDIWPLLTMPVAARVKRLGERLKPHPTAAAA
ncbi:glycosyltransferase family 2 protein [Phenylobacterium sp.]|jgi:succinoglycan biosynthesis protein ExoO|uniref:glycosyltransferase family 2 protein n=1 Tax=Phenylobacterium sp. TaxID=1871053 RepID=UPI002F940A66